MKEEGKRWRRKRHEGRKKQVQAGVGLKKLLRKEIGGDRDRD